MILLGIDTATESTSFGICKLGDPPHVISFSGIRRQLESIGTAVAELMSSAGVSRSEITAIALDVGPGLFTGLRVGVTFAKTFAGALGVPIVAISSLDVLAFSQKNCSKLIVSMIDARRGEVFYSMYRRVPGGVARVSQIGVGKPESVAVEIEEMAEPVLLVGNGANRYRDEFARVSQTHFGGSAVGYPLMPMLFEIAFPLVRSERFSSPDEVDVIYIRDADAKANFQIRPAFGNGA